MPFSYVEQLLKDYKRSENRWIGLEVERFAINSERKLVAYEPEIRLLLEELVAVKGWKVDYEVDGRILGVSKHLNAISVEPGSQFEVSLQPRKTIFEIQKLQMEIDSELTSLKASQGWSFLGLGLNPWQEAADRELLPSPRYRLMNAHFEALKGRGQEMMRLSCGLQVNLDFAHEQEGIEMLRTAFFLAPFLSAAFCNSPFYKRKATGGLSERHLIWDKTDDARSGFIERVFDEDFSLKSYAHHICKMPLMYAYDHDGNVFNPGGKSLCQLPSDLQEKNALAAMRQIFTEVRLKPCCVEVRFFDQVPEKFRYAAVGMTVGLLYDNDNRKKIGERYSHKKISELSFLMKEGAMMGMRQSDIYIELCQLVQWAHDGLRRRGMGEEIFLNPIKTLIDARETPADLLLKSVKQIDSVEEFLRATR